MKYLIIILVIFASPLFFFEREKKDQEILTKIEQMIILGFRGTEISQVDLKIEPGGVIFFDYDLPSQSHSRNIEDSAQTQQLIADLQREAKIPLFVAIDLEGGRVNRLQRFFDFQSAQELGEEDDLSKTRKVSENIAQELKKLGFNLNFAPVIDLNINPENPIIGALGRSFSADPEKVFLHADAFIQGHDEYNIVTVLKHFPGHGSSLEDSHLGIVDITKTYQKEELIPYFKIIEDHFKGMVMTAHLINREIDYRPASLSPNFIKLLREEINFQGVIVSDDLHMGAVINQYGIEEAAILAVKAGNDLLIISNNWGEYDEEAGYKASNAIFQAVKEGRISEERIDQSYQRIMELKKDLLYSYY